MLEKKAGCFLPDDERQSAVSWLGVGSGEPEHDKVLAVGDKNWLIMDQGGF